MKPFENLAAVLHEAGSRDRSIRFINGDKDESSLSFRDLRDRAMQLLATLQKQGMAPGDELVIFVKSNESFVIAFWAAILGGIVPVPVAVGISDEHRLKLFRILMQLKRGTLYTEPELLQRLFDFAEMNDLRDVQSVLEDKVVMDGGMTPSVSPAEIFEPRPGDTAFIQYSSGSTSEPKGVCLTHANLASNIRAIVEGARWTDEDRSLSWMPLTHDMGLIGFHLSVLAAQMDHAIMDTGLFIRRPLLWMSKADELSATQLCSPNFGFKHFLNMYLRKGMDQPDLSRVRLIMNGAEPISWDLCEEFLQRLEPFGLRRSAMFPVYGLAEATVAVSFPTPGHEYSRVVLNRHSLRVGAPFEPVHAQHDEAVSFVKVGRAVRDCHIRITGDAGELLPPGSTGHIELKGRNVTESLYNDPQGERALFTEDGWLRTGDVGALIDEELIITGRSKDIIIVNGQNYYPHDIEEVIAQVDGFDLGKIVVTGANRGSSQTEEIVVFLLYRQALDAFRPLADTVREVVGTRTGLEVDHVIPVSRIPKTTSGKVQRSQLAAAYGSGEFDDVLQQLAPRSDVSGPEDSGLAQPRDPLIQDLEQICQEFSKERNIGPDDNLFEVGVSSLTLTEIVLAIDEKYPGKVDISDLFDYPTIRQIAAFMRR